MANQTGRVALTLLAAICACTTTPSEPPAEIDLAFVNARIWTGEPSAPWVDAIAVGGERIVATGTSDAIKILAGDATIVDLQDQLVVPGFIDTYTRLLHNTFRSTLDLSSIRTQRQLVAVVAAAVTERPDGEWIIGHDWDLRLWET